MSTTDTLAGRDLMQVAVACSDLPRAVGFYRDLLGLPLMFEISGMAFFKVGNTRLMVGTNVSGDTTPRDGTCFYFDAPDLPELAAGLEAKGLAFMGPAEVLQKTEAGELQLRFFRDPDGNLLALMGTVAAR